MAPLRDRSALPAPSPLRAADVAASIRTDVALRAARHAHDDGRAAAPRELARHEREPGDEEEEHARHERDGGYDDRIDVSPESRKGRSQRWEQDDRAHDQGYETTRGEKEVARDLYLGDEEHDREDQESDARGARIEGAESEEREGERDHAAETGEDEARIAELEDDPVRADREQEHGDLRIDDEVEERLEGIRPVFVER